MDISYRIATRAGESVLEGNFDSADRIARENFLRHIRTAWMHGHVVTTCATVDSSRALTPEEK